MPIPNRELSQFGSFLYIDNTTKSIGIATTASPYIGIGTEAPTHKVTVVGNVSVNGDTNVSGIISATEYYLNGNPLVNAALETWSTVGSDIYRLNGNVGIGTSVPASKLSVSGSAEISGNIISSGDVTVSGNVASSGNLTVSGNTNIIGVTTSSRFISTVTTGTSPLTVTSQTLVTNLNADYLRGKTPPSGSIVGDTDNQTLTNKTLTLPTFGSTGVAFTGSTSGVSTVRASATASGIVEIPSVIGIQTFITTNSVGLVTSGMISDLSIVNADVATNAAITYSKLSLSNSIVNADIASGASIAISKLASSTISGISLGSNLNSLTFGSYLTSSGSFDGSTARTVSVAGTSINTANTLVARDGSGDFTAGSITGSSFNATTTDAFRISGTTIIDSGRNLLNVVNANFSGILTTSSLSITDINATNGNFSGIVTATDFNSTSDINLKENIHTVENSLETIQSLRGVSFDWKESGKKSYGVIAQELQEILPDLVSTGEIKSVNYNGLIGILIEAVKELSAEINELKKNQP